MIRRCVRYEQDEYACLTCTRDECAYDEEERIQSQLLRAYEQKERGFDGPPSALLEYDDREQTLTAWVRELGLDYMTVYMRMRRGATVEEALTKEPRMPRKEKKRRMDLNKLAMEVHAAAVAKGFWRAFDAEERNIACLHAEISEAVQADRLGMPICEIERDGGKPEGVGVELADFAMRLLDYAAYRGANLRPLVVTGTRHCSLPHLGLSAASDDVVYGDLRRRQKGQADAGIRLRGDHDRRRSRVAEREQRQPDQPDRHENGVQQKAA